MAEKFTFQKVFRDRSTIDGDKGARLRGAILVKGFRDEFL